MVVGTHDPLFFGQLHRHIVAQQARAALGPVGKLACVSPWPARWAGAPWPRSGRGGGGCWRPSSLPCSRRPAHAGSPAGRPALPSARPRCRPPGAAWPDRALAESDRAVVKSTPPGRCPAPPRPPAALRLPIHPAAYRPAAPENRCQRQRCRCRPDCAHHPPARCRDTGSRSGRMPGGARAAGARPGPATAGAPGGGKPGSTRRSADCSAGGDARSRLKLVIVVAAFHPREFAPQVVG